MKKGKSLADQLHGLRKSVPTSTRRKHEEAVFRAEGCTDRTTGLALISFKAESAATLETEALWNTSSVSTSVVLCERCSLFHLLDEQGLPLVEKSRRAACLSEEEGAHESARQVRSRCPNCRSGTGDSKAIFKSVAEAQAALDDLRVRIPHILDAYYCPHGNGIHLTKQSPRRFGEHVAALFQRKSTEQVPATESTLVPGQPFKCVSCGYTRNLRSDLKCAWCGELGPYERVNA